MAKSELRKLLDDELDALAEPMRTLTQAARDFWRHPEAPQLAVWANFPPAAMAPDPPVGTLTEEALWAQLHNTVKPALDSRRHGFDTVPVLVAHDRHYHGPPFGTHFLAAVMGAEIVFPDSLPPGERTAWRAGVRPLIEDLSDIGRLEDLDVSQSAPLVAILRAYEELAEIVQGRIPFTHYSPTLPLDFAADIIGHERFFELVAGDPEGASRLLAVCTSKWIEMMQLQERSASGAITAYLYQPGISVSDMILPYMSPRAVRQIVIPYNARLSAAFGGISLNIGHPDESLLDDYVRIPGVCSCGCNPGWPAARVLAALRGKYVLTAGLNWHFHKGKTPGSPACIPWEEHCRRLAPFAGRLRVLASLSAWGDTPDERRACLLGDLGDLRRIWEEGAGSCHEPCN